MRAVLTTASAVSETTQIWGEVRENISRAPTKGERAGCVASAALYRLSAVSCVIGEARVGVIDKSFIGERPLDCGWRSGPHKSW